MPNKGLLPGYNNSIEKILKDLRLKPESYWQKRGERASLKLFRRVASRVPAYRDFLKKRGVNPDKIKTIADFRLIPPIDKNTYLRKYPLDKLCWDGKFTEVPQVFSATSGTSGEPFYFPRQEEQDLQYALTAELYLRNNFKIHKRSTLYINGFALGVWIGGLFTFEAITKIARRRNYHLSIINPGTNKAEILKAVKNLGGLFDQIILAGYPPFIKDVADQGNQQGITWKNYNVKIIFSAEGFTENFRDYLGRQLNLKNIFTDSLNHFGTADLGTMSHETPLAVLIRRLAHKNPQLHQSIFSLGHKIPTLTQYLPELFYFEKMGTNLLCSADSGLPLIRYNLHDRGDLLTMANLKTNLAHLGIGWNKAIKKARISSTVWNLPFVSVYERDDFMVKLHLHEIHPEFVRDALIAPAARKFLTGKFMMMAKFNAKQDQYLELNLELKKGTKSDNRTKKIIYNNVIKTLTNRAFGPGGDSQGLFQKPGLLKIVYWPYEHPMHFRAGTKQKWINK